MAKYPMIHLVNAQAEYSSSIYSFITLSNQTLSAISDLNIFTVLGRTDTNADNLYEKAADYPRLQGGNGAETGAAAAPKFWASTANNGTARPSMEPLGILSAFSIYNVGYNDAGIISWQDSTAMTKANIYRVVVAWGWETGSGNSLNCGSTFSVSSGTAYPASPSAAWYTDANNHRFTTGDNTRRPSSPTVQAFGRNWVMTAQNVSWTPAVNDVHQYNGADNYTVSSASCFEIGGTASTLFTGVWSGAAANKDSGVYVTIIKYTSNFGTRATASWSDIMAGMDMIIPSSSAGFPANVYYEEA